MQTNSIVPVHMVHACTAADYRQVIINVTIVLHVKLFC